MYAIRSYYVIVDGYGSDLSVRLGHAACHRPAHATQGFQWPYFRQHFGGTLHVSRRHHAIGTARGHDREVDIEAAGKRTHGRHRLNAKGRGACLRGLLIDNLFTDFDAPNHGSYNFV